MDAYIQPNAETIAAMEAAERGEFTHTFNSPAELMAYLNAPEPPVDMFQFTSLFATSTNLPVTFWISVQGFVTTDPHDPSASNPPEVKQWIELNRDALLAHWRGELDSAELVNICANYPWVTNSHFLMLLFYRTHRFTACWASATDGVELTQAAPSERRPGG